MGCISSQLSWNKQGWLVSFCLITFIVSLIISYIASIGLITTSTVNDISDKYSLPITPSNWTFIIWAFIYTWYLYCFCINIIYIIKYYCILFRQGLWQIYIIYLSCFYSTFLRRRRVILLNVPFYICFILVNILNSIWIIIWCNDNIIGAGIILVIITILLYICTYISHEYLLQTLPFIVRSGIIVFASNPDNNTGIYRHDLLTNISIQHKLYILILNGLPMYAFWCTVSSCINIAIILSYKSNIDTNISSIIMLSILTVIILIYCSLDFKFLKHYLRYTFSPYITLIISFIGIISNKNESISSQYFVIILLICTCIATILKFIMTYFTFNMYNPL